MTTKFLTTDEVAALVRTKPATVRWWRHVGKGPRFTRLPGARRVLYTEADVLAWAASGQSRDPGGAAA